MGVDLQADKAVLPSKLLKKGQENVGGHLHVPDGQGLVGPLDAFLLIRQFLNGSVVVPAAGDGLFKDGRIGSDAFEPVFFDEPAQFPRGN